MLMRVKSLEFQIPILGQNPFSTSPLEGNQGNLYVGRLDIRGRISQHINFMSNRRILMVGDSGSGRTSLLRCLGHEAPVYVHIDYISASMPGQSLLERMYSELIDYQIPGNSVELVNKMVEFSRSFENKLPLIVIDLPNVEGSVLSVALRDVLPALERLKAVVVVVVEPKQRTNIPESVINSFANIETLSPLSINELQELVERRIATVSDEIFDLSIEDASIIHRMTNGVPIEIIKLLRDTIDNNMMNQKDINYTNVKSNSVLTEPIEKTPVGSKNSIDKNIFEQKNDDIIDASIPWHERIEEENNNQPVFQESLFGFELDLDELSESQSFDESVENHTFSATPKTEEFIESSVSRRPVIDAGAFGGLLGRTREFDDKEELTIEEMVNDGNFQGAELWVSKDLIEPEDRIEFTELDSAELIHDEIGINSELEFDDLEVKDESETKILDEVDEASISKLVTLISNLLNNNVKGEENNSNIFINSLLNLSNQKFSQKQDFPLNPIMLSNLNQNESYVLSIARVRKYSPSDIEMLNHLGVKRPRLSQISNKLLKSGILSVRIKGRSRYFELTQAARAQLIAWGIIGGEE